MRAGIPLDGAWEQPGRNPMAAGVAGFLITGGAYLLVTTAAGAAIVLVMAGRAGGGAAGWADLMQGFQSILQVPLLLLAMAGEIGGFFLLTVLLVRRWHSTRPFAYLSFHKPDALVVLLAGLGALAAIPIAEGLGRLFSSLFPMLRRFAVGDAALIAADTPLRAVLVTAAIAVTPALCEETLFRGWLQGTLRRRMPAPAVIAIQALVFSLCHLSPMTIAAIVFLGVYLGWLQERSGTLFASMTAHCLYNAAVIVLANVHLFDEGFPVLTIAVSAFVLTVVIALIELRVRKLNAARTGGGET